MLKKQHERITSATRQVRQQWFSVGFFPPGLLFGLTGNCKIHRNGMHGVSTDSDAKGREADAKRREASRLYHV